MSVSAAEAADWLSGLVSHGSSRAASDAVLPLVVADAPDPWPLLLRVARDDERPKPVRNSALMWLSSAVTEHLGIARASGRSSDDDEVREQAVFAITQRPHGESVPALIDIVRTAQNPAARRAAIFWLGQTGDRRAADVYAELLGIR
jgi:HEAT repeat protein